jgi:hypothetical protein
MSAGAQVRMVDARFALPELFVRAYGEDLREWGRNLSKVGRCARIMLRPIPGAPVVLDDHGCIPMHAVELVASVERITSEEVRLLIAAEDEQSSMLIAKHCEAIMRYGLPRSLAEKRAAEKALN